MKTVEILADSLNVETGDRLTTFLLHRFPKILWQEPLTHRSLSRNSASSRAIPIKKVIEQVKNDPYIPDWTAHQKGMVGSDSLTYIQKLAATASWLKLRDAAVACAEEQLEIGIAKQDANRGLEPWMFVACVATATDWDAFFNLRCADDVQPDLRRAAIEMRDLQAASRPHGVIEGEWHIPFVASGEFGAEPGAESLSHYLKVSTARAARCSFQNHLNEVDYDKDYALHDRLLQQQHHSPFEHCAKALPTQTRCRNFSGFMSYRAHIEDSVSVLPEPNLFIA